jgi:hypothetical protein
MKRIAHWMNCMWSSVVMSRNVRDSNRWFQIHSTGCILCISRLFRLICVVSEWNLVWFVTAQTIAVLCSQLAYKSFLRFKSYNYGAHVYGVNIYNYQIWGRCFDVYQTVEECIQEPSFKPLLFSDGETHVSENCISLSESGDRLPSQHNFIAIYEKVILHQTSYKIFHCVVLS